LAKQREMNEEKLSERAKEINLALENEIKLKFLESQNATIKNILNIQKKKIKELESKLVAENNSIKIIEKTKEFESLVNTKNSIIKNYRRSKIQFDITLTKLRSKIVLLKKQDFQKDSLLNKKKLLYKKKLAKLIGEYDLKAIRLLSGHKIDSSKFEKRLEDRQFAELKIENKKLKSENVDLKEKLESECCNLTNLVIGLKHDLSEFEKKLEDLSHENNQLESKNIEMGEKLNTIIFQARRIAYMASHSDSLSEIFSSEMNRFLSLIPNLDFATLTSYTNKTVSELILEMLDRFVIRNTSIN
jgi:hypothetical protein